MHAKLAAYLTLLIVCNCIVGYTKGIDVHMNTLFLLVSMQKFSEMRPWLLGKIKRILGGEFFL